MLSSAITEIAYQSYSLCDSTILQSWKWHAILQMKVAAPLIQATSNPQKNSKGESWGNKPKHSNN